MIRHSAPTRKVSSRDEDNNQDCSHFLLSCSAHDSDSCGISRNKDLGFPGRFTGRDGFTGAGRLATLMKLALMALRNSAWWVVLGLLEQIQSTSHRVSTASLSIVHVFPIRQDTVLSRKSDHQTLECVLHWLSYIVICGFSYRRSEQ